MLTYKSVKNVQKPGRPPKGYTWEKDAEGNIVQNENGELGYREATDAEVAAKAAAKAAKAAKKKMPRKKKGAKRGRKAVPGIPAAAQTSLTLKSTYASLSYAELDNVHGIIGGLMAKRKDVERKRLEKKISEIQAKLETL